MATQSATPPTLTGEEPPKPASEVVQLTMKTQDDVQVVASKENGTSVFVNNEPIREEQVQNAVKFLSHPKVRGSPIIYRRSFLERKGLTKEEIDEAFHLVPDPPTSVSSVQSAGMNQDGQLMSTSNSQPQTPTQTLPVASATPAGAISKVVTLQQYRFHWSQAFLAVGLLAVSGAGSIVLFKKAIVPRLKSWIRKVVLEEEGDLVKKTNSTPTLVEEAAAATKAAAAAAADMEQASKEMLTSKTEEKRCFNELVSMLNAQVEEMRSMSNTIRKLEEQSSTSGRISAFEQDDHRVRVSSSKQSNANGNTEFGSYTVRSSSPSAAVEPSVAPHTKSYMEEIYDLPPNPNQQFSNPRLEPRFKPWEVGQSQGNPGHVLRSQGSSDGINSYLPENGLSNPLNGNSSVPWWQRKNARITEIESEDELKMGSTGVLTNGQPVRRSWFPPQPPPVAVPEAATAIRQPKKPLFQKEQLADDQLLSHPSD